jgi:hypothetical protein
MWHGIGVPGGTDPFPIWTALRVLAAQMQRRIEPGPTTPAYRARMAGTKTAPM